MKMMKIRLTKQFDIELAHALWNYDGVCKNVHGHSYRLYVSVIGTPNPDKNSPKQGMVIDFGELDAIIKENIVQRFDHAFVVYKEAPHANLLNIEQMFERIEVVDYQPTCENMIAAFASIIKNKIPSSIQLHSLKLYETPTAYAEWFASDNA